MKKLLSILSVVGLTATSASSVMAMSPVHTKAESNDANYVTTSEFDSAYKRQQKVKNSYVKSFLTANNEIGISSELFDRIHALGDQTNLTKYESDLIKSEITSKFNVQLQEYGLIGEGQKLDSNLVRIENIKLQSSSPAWGAKGRPGFSLALKYGTAKASFNMTGFFVQQNLLVPLAVVNKDNIKEFYEASKPYMADMQNVGGYMMFEKWDGPRDANKSPIGTQRISVENTNKLGLSYLEGWMKAAGVLTADATLNYDDFTYNFVPDNTGEGQYEFNAYGGWHGTMPNASKTVTWKDQSEATYTYNVSGAIYCLDANSQY